MSSMLRKVSYALLLAALPVQSSIAAAQLADVCGKMNFKAYPVINIGPGAGTVYLDSGKGFSASTANIACTGVFKDMSDTEINATGFVGNEVAEKTRSGSLAVGLLSLILGPANTAKISASISRGVKWDVKTAPFSISGQNQLGVLTFFAKDNNCFKKINAALGGKGSINIYVIAQVAQTKEINYTLTKSGSTDIGADINIDKLVTVQPSDKFQKTSANSLSLNGGPFNVCYAPPVKKKLKRSTNVGPKQFTIY